MTKFRLPRKTKKAFSKDIWLYPADEKGNSLVAWPHRSQEDYDALKQRRLRGLIDRNDKAGRKERMKELDKEIIIADEVLKRYVDDLIREDVRASSYRTLLAAKNNPKAVTAYYNFVNAYQLFEKSNSSYGNICCMAIDKAKELLKESRKRG